MKQNLKRISVVALAAITASLVNALAFAPSASAGQNTWIRPAEPSGVPRPCITATSEEYSAGKWKVVGSEKCNRGDRSQLWDRRGATIRKAYKNQCLDSNHAGKVYYMECNGGDYQKWKYHSDGSVQNVATGRYLRMEPVSDTYMVYTQTNNINNEGDIQILMNKWVFYGGE